MRLIACLFAVCLLTLGSALAVTSGEKVKTKGVITNRMGDTLIVKTADGPFTVVLSSDTKILQPVGLGARHKEVSPDVMIPGLKLKFEGVGDDQNRVLAKRIEYENDDLILAEVIQAGLNPTAQQQAANMERYAVDKTATDAAIAAANQEIAANKQMIAANQSNIRLVADKTKERFSELTEWVPKAEATVHFNTGESVISDEHKKEIAALAENALKYKGYVIEVKGYADSIGRLTANQVLSKERAEAVVAYLLQDCHVPVKNIVAPGAMSETNPVASNETGSGRSENRRVELRVLVNRGVAGPMGN
jgi:outer membrane protein OmpA-like peptidoglycan-associated protein